MNLTKKVLALVMAVVMLASVFAFSASALTYAPSMTTGDLGIIMSADKTEVKPGDTVTFSVMIDKGSYSDFGPWMTTIVYSSSHLAPVSTTNTTFRQYTNECANFMKQTSTVNFNYPIAQLTALTTDEKAYYDKAIMMNGVVDTSVTTNAAGNGWTPADANTAQVTFQMVVADGLAAGTEIWIGNHEATYTKGVSYMSPAGGTRYANTVYDLTSSMIKLTVAADETTIVNPLKGQIRFDKDANGAYAGTFDVRALATITEADFKATFTDAETAEDMIKEIGFVFASGENVGTPDMPGVKALVENGTALSGYKKKTVDYISTGATNVEAGNYVFSCIVKDIPEADKADSLVAVGYIAWDSNDDGTVDKYNYYPAAQTISFNALYTAHYNSAFPQA